MENLCEECPCCGRDASEAPCLGGDGPAGDGTCSAAKAAWSAQAARMARRVEAPEVRWSWATPPSLELPGECRP